MPSKSELKYHIVWCTKYRRKVLTTKIQGSLKQHIEDVCTKNKFTILALEVMEDHVHIFIQSTPKISVHRIVSQIKSYTAFKLREEFVELKSRLPCMWTRSYYVGTVGHVAEETIKNYIINQKNK